MTRGLKDLFVVAAGTVRFFFRSCYDELVERRIGALLPLGPSVLSFVVVTR